MIRVVIADDHTLVRKGIRALLEQTHDIEVVGEAADGHEAINLVHRLTPDVLLIDISMPRLNGTQTIERIRVRHITTHVVILSMHFDDALVRQTFRQGAKGYVVKQSITDDLLLAVRAAACGEMFLSPEIPTSIIDDLSMREHEFEPLNPIDRLSPREREVLQLVAEGHTNISTAHEMNISVKTVEKHRASLMSKMDVRDMAGLMREAFKYKFIFIDEPPAPFDQPHTGGP